MTGKTLRPVSTKRPSVLEAKADLLSAPHEWMAEGQPGQVNYSQIYRVIDVLDNRWPGLFRPLGPAVEAQSPPRDDLWLLGWTGALFSVSVGFAAYGSSIGVPGWVLAMAGFLAGQAGMFGINLWAHHIRRAS